MRVERIFEQLTQGSLLYQMDLQTDHEQKICKQLEINECSFLFMESDARRQSVATSGLIVKPRWGSERISAVWKLSRGK